MIPDSDHAPNPTAPTQADDEILFAEEGESSPIDQSWKILVVDDDAEVHNVTRLALRDYRFAGKCLSFISAYSAQEARQLIQTHPDTAIAFVDVVMETDDAGLQLVRYLREELQNPLVRIILRTGQPGRAPEDLVVRNYGIDDYKTKTELTSQKLSNTVTIALRTFSTLTNMLELVRNADYVPALRSGIAPSLEHSRPLPQSQETLEPLSRLIVDVADEFEVNQGADSLSSMSAITRIAKMVLRATDEHFARLGISQTKLAVLMYLNSEPDLSASPSSLASHCDVSRAAMTGLLDALEQDGFVERAGHPSDRRALMIRLTAKGQEFLDWAVPRDQYHLSELMQVLNQGEREKLLDLATTVIRLAKE
jgi:DNA-binding MarR family transcriptional regulator/DNA-binding response OmpR family regulator